MREVLDDLSRWWTAGGPVGMATVVGTWRSAPRTVGAVMLVGPDGTVAGSVSGGCVEGDVYEVARQIRDGGEATLRRYGVSDDDAFAVGLTCGGIIDIYVERVDQRTFPELTDVIAAIRAGNPVSVITCVDGPAHRVGRRVVLWPGRTAPLPGPATADTRHRPLPRTSGELGHPRLDAAAADDALGLLAAGRAGTLRYGVDGQRRGDDLTLFVASFAPPPRMIVFGAIDFAAAVARVGTFLGYRVTVCDARPVFATARRFPDADEVVVQWPHRYLRAQAEAGALDQRTVLCVLTHDPKFDGPLLEVALRLPVAYVGAMGSRRTHADRLARLREAGLNDMELARLSSPIGLDLGARTPEETAVSVAAEIIAERWGGTGQRLTGLDTPIHLTPAPEPDASQDPR